MKRASIGLLAALVLGACSETGSWQAPSSAYRHFGDRMKASLPAFFGLPCGAAWNAARPGMPYDQCYRVGAPRRMTGIIYEGQFTDARFFPDLAEPPKDGLWATGASLAVSDRYALAPFQQRRIPERRAAMIAEATPYRVTFVGRESSTFPSRWLHSVVIVDRFESIRRLGLPASRDRRSN